MSWPANCIRGVDWSYFQSGLNVAEFVQKNPTVERYFVRAVWPNQSLDPAFHGFYSALEASGRAPGAYFWPNPAFSMAQVQHPRELVGREYPRARLGEGLQVLHRTLPDVVGERRFL